MKILEGQVQVDHPREPWGWPPFPPTVVHTSLDTLRGRSAAGSERRRLTAGYAEAKYRCDVSAAFDIIDRVISEDALDRIAGHFSGEPPPIYVSPNPAFAEGDGGAGAVITNAIPMAYARYLAATLGGTPDTEILQAHRVGRTDLSAVMRFLCQPCFRGKVDTNRPYIVLDDVMTTGGTLAALRSFIISKGGRVMLSSTLATVNGVDRPLAIAAETCARLRGLYGRGLDNYWRGTIGHGVECLTEGEGSGLLREGRQWTHAPSASTGGPSPLDRLRARLNEAATKGT